MKELHPFFHYFNHPLFRFRHHYTIAALAPYVEDPEVEGAGPPKVRKVRGKGILWVPVMKHATMAEAFANYSKAKLIERGLSTLRQERKTLHPPSKYHLTCGYNNLGE